MKYKSKAWAVILPDVGSREEFSSLAKASAASGVSQDLILRVVGTGKVSGPLGACFEVRDVEYRAMTKMGDEVVLRWDAERKALVEKRSGMALKESWLDGCPEEI